MLTVEEGSIGGFAAHVMQVCAHAAADAGGVPPALPLVSSAPRAAGTKPTAGQWSLCAPSFELAGPADARHLPHS